MVGAGGGVGTNNIASVIAHRAAEGLEGAARRLGGEAEVRDDNVRVVALVAQQQVLGLEVAVRNLTLRQEVERLEQRAHDAARVGLRVDGLLDDAVEQLPPAATSVTM